MPQRHGHHDRQGQSNAGLHLGQPPNEVPFEAEAVVDLVVDPLQGAASVIAPMPSGTAMGRGDEDAAVVVGDLDAHDTPIGAG